MEDTTASIQDHVQSYLKNCAINALARNELTEIIETIEHLERHNMLLGKHYISMAFIIRLGSVIENGLREFYMNKTGYESTYILKKSDTRLNKTGIFQRLERGKNICALDIFDEINIKIEQNEFYKGVQEILEHRHLYAHNSGVFDERYIANIFKITNEDIRKEVQSLGYPEKDILWLRPLQRVQQYTITVDHFLNTLS